ncbi:MAG: Stealth CR1 domain-containing protein [Desulfobacula sp.]|uniref:Stealth CR1 domain-containing protein n=1 Tax=Desulfobacula sp. TaxID=2593537 RepID=UPI0025C28AF9|nr:Stealth CR1 domain-containing protein [Desulfobacula sp.]MCD4718370.1 Stealth CR1 domain-containing protein [Desulfobacula sp.]
MRINKSGIFIRLRLSKGWGCVLWENDFPIQILSVKDNGSYFIPENKLARKRYGYINKVWVLDNNKNTEVDECQFDIDMVYTWVDDSDPEWLEKKEACLRLLSNDNSHHVTSFSSSRFKNRDELLFSLRSVEYYAPFIRKIFIVTDGQIPKWLDIKNKKIIIVDHTDIFDDLTHLPTFNSHAIEMHLHRIMGLSDHYIYMNDDFFLRRRVNPSDFFELPNGNTKVFFSSQRIPVENIGLDLLPVDTAAINGQKLLETHFYVKVTNKLKHMPYPQNKPLIKEICSKFNEFTKTSSTKFRSKSDYSLPASFYHHYALLAGKAQKDELPYLYADIGSRHFLSILNYIRFSGKYKSFCINDTGDSSYLPSDKIDKLLDILFNKIYPYKAEFEK